MEMELTVLPQPESFWWAAGTCLASALSQAGKGFKRSYKKLEIDVEEFCF